MRQALRARPTDASARSAPDPAEVAPHQLDALDGRTVIRRRPSRSRATAARSTGRPSARASVTCGRNGSAVVEPERPRGGRRRGAARRHRRPRRRTRRRARRPDDGKAPSRPVAARAIGRIARRPAETASAIAGDGVGVDRSEEGERQVPALRIGPAQPVEVRSLRAMPRRRRRSAAPQLVADRDGDEAAPALASSAVESRVDDRQELVERRDDRHALGHLGRVVAAESVDQHPVDPDPASALDIGVDVVADVDDLAGVGTPPARAPTRRCGDAASRSRCVRWRR